MLKPPYIYVCVLDYMGAGAGAETMDADSEAGGSGVAPELISWIMDR